MIWYTRFLPLILMAIAAIIGLFFFKKQSLDLKIVITICCFNFISDLIGNAIGLFNINNHWLYNISDFIRNELWVVFFYLILKVKSNFKYIIQFILLSYPILFITVQFIQPIFILQSISYIAGGILIIICCFMYYLFEFQNDNENNLFESPYFWIATGLTIYYALNIPFLGLLPWLLKHTSAFVNYYFYICVLGSSFLLSLFKIKAFLCLKLK